MSNFASSICNDRNTARVVVFTCDNFKNVTTHIRTGCLFFGHTTVCCESVCISILIIGVIRGQFNVLYIHILLWEQ